MPDVGARPAAQMCMESAAQQSSFTLQLASQLDQEDRLTIKTLTFLFRCSKPPPPPPPPLAPCKPHTHAAPPHPLPQLTLAFIMATLAWSCQEHSLTIKTLTFFFRCSLPPPSACPSSLTHAKSCCSLSFRLICLALKCGQSSQCNASQP